MTINNPDDFDTLKTLNADNWKALRRIGAHTNARFLAALGEGQPDLPDPATLESFVMATMHDGQRAPGLRFGDPRVMALLSSIAAFAHVMGGLTNPTLRAHMAARWSPDYTTNRATYDLRRLRLKGLIERIPRSSTYRVTARGRSLSIFPTKLANRVIVPNLTNLDNAIGPQPPAPRFLLTAWRDYEHRLEEVVATAGLAARKRASHPLKASLKNG